MLKMKNDYCNYNPLQHNNEGIRKLLDSLDRRRFIKNVGFGLGYASLGATLTACGGGSSEGNQSDDSNQTLDTSIPTPSEEFTVLKRTSLGMNRDALDRIKQMGINAYLQEQLDYTTIDDGSLEDDIETRFPSAFQSPAELITGFPDNIGTTALHTASATQYRQIYSKRHLYEVMVEFWTNHFNIQLLNGLGPTLKPYDDLNVIRSHALGNFGDLLKATAESPAMLFYLDNFDNKALAPNENYARELMELHTLGVDGGYTEQDIKEVARCFTGWRLRFPGEPGGDYGEFLFDETIHDTGSKQVLGQIIPANGGKSDGDQVLDLLLAQPATARFIARKLCQRFISDTPLQETIDAVADAFTQSNGDIKTLLSALFATNEFTNSQDQKFTRPTEYLCSLINALSPNQYPNDDGELFYFAQAILGQLPMNWPTPDGYPDESSYWASTGGMLNRWRLAFLSYSGAGAGISQLTIDPEPLVGNAENLIQTVDALAENILMRPLSETDREIILADLEATYLEPFLLDRQSVLPDDSIIDLARYIAAVLFSSAYFQLR